MPKKEKGLRDLDLREIVAGVQSASTSIDMYAESKEQLERVLSHAEFSAKLFKAVADLKSFSQELSKRFNAPAHYEEER